MNTSKGSWIRISHFISESIAEVKMMMGYVF